MRLCSCARVRAGSSISPQTTATLMASWATCSSVSFSLPFSNLVRSAGLEGRAVAGACGRAGREAQAKRATPAPSSTPVTWPQSLPGKAGPGGRRASSRGAHPACSPGPAAWAGGASGPERACSSPHRGPGARTARQGGSVRSWGRAGPARSRCSACSRGASAGRPEGRARAAARLPSGGLSQAGRLPGPRRSRSSSAEGALLPMDGREPGARWVRAARGAAAAASGAPQGVGAGSHRRPTSRSPERQALQARGRDALPRAQAAGPPRTDPKGAPGACEAW